MMEGAVWNEVRHRWAPGFWDEFMRRPDVRRGRHCIRPEVSRSATFGEQGTSAGQFFKKHLSRIKLNAAPVDWKALDLGHLASAASFDRHLTERLRRSVPADLATVDSESG